MIRTSDSSTITLNSELALDRLKMGDIIAMPTETVYGFAADAAHELYSQLRRAAQSDAEAIVIELPPNTDAWKAISKLRSKL